MRVTRRHFIAGATALPVYAIGQARAAEYNFRLPHDLPATHPLHVRAAEASVRIREKTSGRVDITLFPDSQLGSDVKTIDMVRAGTVELFSCPGIILSSAIPAASLNGVGFAFSSYPRIWAAMDGGLGNYIRGEISKYGVIPVGRIANNGFRQNTSSTKPIRVPDDYKGMKLRVPASPLSLSLFRTLGAEPSAINLNEVYAALKSHVVDAQETPLALVEAGKFYEVQTFCSLTNHMWDGYWMLANESVWRGLPGPVRDTIEQELDRAAMEERADLARRDPGMRGDMAEAGLEINSIDTALFRQALQRAGFYKEWRGTFGEKAWAVLEEAAGGLT